MDQKWIPFYNIIIKSVVTSLKYIYIKGNEVVVEYLDASKANWAMTETTSEKAILVVSVLP